MDERLLTVLRELVPSSSKFDEAVLDDLFEIADVVHGIERRIRELAARSGLPALHFFLLEELALNGGSAALKDVLVALAVPKQSATYVVDKLEGQGLIERRRSETDRRQIELVLTDQGRALVSREMDPFYRSLLIATDSVSSSDRAVLRDGLQQFLDALGTNESQGQ